MSGLPPPFFDADLPAPPAVPSGHAAHRPGELSAGWTVAFAFGWLGVSIAFAAAWAVSRQLGLSTWWLGPRAQPRPLLVSMIPFVPSVLLIAAAATFRRHLPWYGLGGAAVLVAVAAGDLSRVAGIAVVELVIAAAAALVSIAAWSGMYRRIEPASVQQAGIEGDGQ